MSLLKKIIDARMDPEESLIMYEDLDQNEAAGMLSEDLGYINRAAKNYHKAGMPEKMDYIPSLVTPKYLGTEVIATGLNVECLAYITADIKGKISKSMPGNEQYTFNNN